MPLERAIESRKAELASIRTSLKEIEERGDELAIKHTKENLEFLTKDIKKLQMRLKRASEKEKE